MMAFHITVGMPGSGKSTWVRQMKDWRMVEHVVCPDEIRVRLTGDMSDQSQNDKVFEEAHWLWEKYVYDEESVIFDATNLKPGYRKPLLESVRRFGGEPVAHYFSVPYETCWQRNIQRARIVPIGVMERMNMLFQEHCKPHILDEEGWIVVIHT